MSDRHQYTAARSLVDELLAEQRTLTAVERFSAAHDRGTVKDRYSALLPARRPVSGEQYRFEVNLDACTGCKACVVACHSLNGLDDDESFRDVGLITGDGYQQTVTSACHHCADPACANGCPVQAYEKEAYTGIVRHLDDQCIGCQYCLLKCPYEVPKYNKRLGIVRKCDMCAQRLEAGEAPACVQACPTSAISIRLVNPDELPAALVPGAFDSRYTRPTTAYRSTRPIPDSARAADAGVLRVQSAHWPLMIMLLLTQLACGWLFVSLWVPALFLPGSAVLFAGLAVSVLHLGRPMGAWRFFLGLRKSWMSREILAFSLLANLAVAVVAGRFAGYALPWAGPVTSGLAVIAVFTSAMIYIDTRRSWWRAGRSLLSFFGAAVIMGCALPFPRLAGLTGIVFLGLEIGLKQATPASYRLEREHLAAWSVGQRVCMLAAIGFQLVVPVVSFVLWVAGFFCERVLFFRAVDAPKMPGGCAR